MLPFCDLLLFLACRLYNDPSSRPKYNLLFVLSGGGKFNYFGTKGLLEEQLEESPLLPTADYTLCLDSLLSSDDTGGLYLHVSKPPKQGSKAFDIVQALNQVLSQYWNHGDVWYHVVFADCKPRIATF